MGMEPDIDIPFENVVWGTGLGSGHGIYLKINN